MIIETQYFPPIDTYIYAHKYNGLKIEAYENYQKKGYRNRCHILGGQNIVRLSIPLESGKNQQMPIQKVRISYKTDWIKQHIQSIRSAYSNSPFFIFYSDDIFDILSTRETYLYSLNKNILSYLCPLLGLSLGETLFYEKEIPTDFRSKIKPNRHEIKHQAYEQVFSNKTPFVPNLSILDALFCLGPETWHYLLQHV